MIRYILLVFAGACSFGILSTFVKVAYSQGYTTADIAGSQACCGMLVLWLLSFASGDAQQTSSHRHSWLHCIKVLAAGAAIGLTSYLYYLSVQWIPASIAIIFLMQFTWMGIALEWLCYRKRPAKLYLWCIGIILAGTFLASGILGKGHHVQLNVKGVLLAMASALVYAVYIMASSRIGNHLPALRKSALMMTGSTIVIFVVAMPPFLFNGSLLHGLAPWAIFLAFFGTIIPPVLFAIGIPRIGVALSAIIMTAELPVAAVTASIVLKEQVSFLQWIGIAIMLLAMALPNIRQLKKA